MFGNPDRISIRRNTKKDFTP